LDIPDGILHNKNEEVRAVIGQSYLASILQGNVQKSCLILSDRRIYHKGKIYQKGQSGGWIALKVEGAVDLEKVSGTKFIEVSYLYLLLIVLAAVAFNFIITVQKSLAVAIIISLVTAAILLPLYFFKRKKLFCVEYPGGDFATNAKWYTEEEMRNFMRELSRLKDRMK